jgi:hypothetical protein
MTSKSQISTASARVAGTLPRFCCNAAVTVAPSMFDSNLLNRRSHFHLLFDRVLLPKRTVEACPAHSRQLTHALDTQAALQ